MEFDVLDDPAVRIHATAALLGVLEDMGQGRVTVAAMLREGSG